MRHRFLIKCAALSLICCSLAHADGLSGKFKGEQLSSEWHDGSGTIILGSNNFPATVKSVGDHFEGEFTANGHSFPFTASRDGDQLSLKTGVTTYLMHSADAPANPLDNPDTTGGDGAFTVLASNDAGKSLVMHKPGITSVKAALETAFPALAKQLGNRPAISKAYEDSQTHQSGGATFAATADGKPIKGIVSCKLNGTGDATIAVVYSKADATRADWDQLTAPKAPAADEKAKPAQFDYRAVLGPDAQTYNFPDGTGSVMLAPGFTTQAQSLADAAVLTGPNDECVIIKGALLVNTHDSPLVKQIESNQAMMRRMGGNPPPPPPIMMAEFTDPQQAIKELIPQFSKMNQAKTGQTSRIKKVVEYHEQPAPMPGWKSALIVLDMIRTKDGAETEFLDNELLTMLPPQMGTWTMYINSISAPADRFEKDKNTLFAMYASVQYNVQAITQVQNQQFQAGSRAIAENGKAFADRMKSSHDAYMDQMNHERDVRNQNFNNYETQKGRNNADFVETIRGTRTVYDTQTGESGTANLYYVDGVVNSLNEAALDPNRFVQIPLRDEMYPVSGK